MKLFIISGLLIISCCFLQTTVQAIDPDWYEVEIIIFEQATQNRLESEEWQPMINLPDINKSRDFLSPDPAKVAIKQLCLQGNMVPVLTNIPVTEIVDEIEEPGETTEIGTGISTVEEFSEINQLIPEEKPFIILDKKLNKLTNLRTSLARRRGYRPLLHVSWRQPGENKRNSQLIRIFAGNNFSDTFNPEGDERVDIASFDPELHTLKNQQINPVYMNNQTTYNQQFTPLDTDIDEKKPFSANSSKILPFNEKTLLTSEDYRRSIKQQLTQCQKLFQQELAARHPDVWQIEGNIRIYRKRYLHLETDLYLRIPGKKELQLGAIETSLAADKLLNSLQVDKNQSNRQQNDSGFGWQLGDNFLHDNDNQSVVMQDVLNEYPLKQSRRMRSNEIHYIDHPLFGLLIQIRSYKKKTVDDNVQTTRL